MKVSPFCPEYCLRINDEDPLLHKDCLHLSDIIMPTPFSAILRIGKPTVVTVVGISGNDYYIEEIMTNGETTRSSVSRDRVERS